MIYWAGAKLFRTEEKVLGDLINHVDVEREKGGKEAVRRWEGRRRQARGLKDLCMGRLMVSLEPK